MFIAYLSDSFSRFCDALFHTAVNNFLKQKIFLPSKIKCELILSVYIILFGDGMITVNEPIPMLGQYVSLVITYASVINAWCGQVVIVHWDNDILRVIRIGFSLSSKE